MFFTRETSTRYGCLLSLCLLPITPPPKKKRDQPPSMNAEWHVKGGRFVSVKDWIHWKMLGTQMTRGGGQQYGERWQRRTRHRLKEWGGQKALMMRGCTAGWFKETKEAGGQWKWNGKQGEDNVTGLVEKENLLSVKPRITLHHGLKNAFAQSWTTRKRSYRVMWKGGIWTKTIIHCARKMQTLTLQCYKYQIYGVLKQNRQNGPLRNIYFGSTNIHLCCESKLYN